MKITISRASLAEALTDLSPLAGKNKILPIFNNVKVVTKGNKIRLQTSDGDTSIRKYVEAEEIDQDGAFLVDCASLNAFLGKVKGDTIVLSIEGDTLTVKHAKGTAQFQTSPAEEFVEPIQEEGATEVEIPAKILSGMTSVAKNFVSDDLLRPQLRCIRAIIENNSLTVCGTDTHMMLVDSTNLGNENTDTQWYIEPCAFSLLIKACKGQENAVIKVSEKNVSYRIDKTTIFTKQTKGKFPDFRRVIPSAHSIDVVCDKRDFVEATQRATLFTPDTNLTKITVNALSMDITADNFDKMRKSVDSVACASNSEITIGVNSKILLDCVGACDADEITIEMNDASRPLVFKDTDNPNRVILCMPMALVNN